MKQGKPDLELLKVIESVKDNTDMTWCQKCSKVLEFEKTRGMKSFHMNIDPFVKDMDNETCAKDLFELFYAVAQGNYETLEEGDSL